jgi:phosphoribosylformylglycinamidine synthase
MLMVLRQGREHVADRIFKKWGLDVAVIGRITDSGRVVIKKDGRVEADLPVGPLADDAPQYDRPYVPTPPRKRLAPVDVPGRPIKEALLRLLGSSDIASKRWIWEQYDHLVRGDTVQRPGGDAAVVRIEGGKKALALTADCTPRYCEADPFAGGVQAVAEAYRNLSAVGARPLAITDCLNFGNPERPEIMGQFVGCVEGMALACAALSFPVVSGNVSLYNETNGQGVQPTPQIGAVGLAGDWTKTATIGFKTVGDAIFLVGETKGALGASLYLREVLGREDGAPPDYDLAAEKRHGEFVRALIADGRLSSCHDVSDGGLLVALAEMALAGGLGADVDPVWEDAATFLPAHAFLFGEDQARYVLAVPAKLVKDVEAAARKRTGVPLRRIGTVGGRALTLGSLGAISLDDMRARHESWLPDLMERD